MNTLTLVVQQRQKESQALTRLLSVTLMGSFAVHAGVMTLRVGKLGSVVPLPDAIDKIELIVEEIPSDLAPQEVFPTELLSELPSAMWATQPVAVTKSVAAIIEPASPASGSQVPTPVVEMATYPDTPNLAVHPSAPLSHTAGETIVAAPGCPPQAIPPVPDPLSPLPHLIPCEPVCLSCPTPFYQGVETSPRMDMHIRPDGSVEIRRRRSSDNSEPDQAIWATMSDWPFDPPTVVSAATGTSRPPQQPLVLKQMG